MVSSKNEVWNTPKYLFRRLDNEFHFNLDAASNDDNALCEKHFTEETDGLKQDWGGAYRMVQPSVLP